MQWLADLLAHLGTAGACANASQTLADEREVSAQLDRFLLRFDHPAGGASTPIEQAAAKQHRVA